MPRERKPLIAPGSVLPAQDTEGGDVMSRIIARDREKRGVPDDAKIQEPVNTGMQEHRDTETRKPVNKGPRLSPGRKQEPINTGVLEPVNTGIQETVSEPTDKATFDLPRSLHQQLKIRAATERRPARAILIDLLTRYLHEEGPRK